MDELAIDLIRPGPRQHPLEIAADTFVIRSVTPSFGGSWTSLNSMLIRAAEPIVVDTGIVTARDAWFEDILSIVAADAVRWIFLTHCDSDHSGNVVEALDRFPNATLITSNAESFRIHSSLGIPFARMRLVDDGDVIHAGDRDLRVLRPPVYDSPYTRGLFDHTTGVYYASDAFCAPMPEEPVDWVSAIPDQLWAKGLAQFHYGSLCPWLALVDDCAFRREVDKLAKLGIETIAGAHTPAIGPASIDAAFAHMASLPAAVRRLACQEAAAPKA